MKVRQTNTALKYNKKRSEWTTRLFFLMNLWRRRYDRIAAKLGNCIINTDVESDRQTQ